MRVIRQSVDDADIVETLAVWSKRSRFQGGADVLQQSEKMVGIARRSNEVVPLIEGFSNVVFRVNRKRTNACDLSRLQRAQHGVLK